MISKFLIPLMLICLSFNCSLSAECKSPKRGPAGPQGIPGAPGAQGPTGPQGIPGTSPPASFTALHATANQSVATNAPILFEFSNALVGTGISWTGGVGAGNVIINEVGYYDVTYGMSSQQSFALNVNGSILNGSGAVVGATPQTTSMSTIVTVTTVPTIIQLLNTGFATDINENLGGAFLVIKKLQ